MRNSVLQATHANDEPDKGIHIEEVRYPPGRAAGYTNLVLAHRQRPMIAILQDCLAGGFATLLDAGVRFVPPAITIAQ